MSEHAGLPFLTFKLSEKLLGVRVSEVEAVYNTNTITRVPGCPEYIKGILNFRGRLVPAVNIQRYLNIPAAETDSRIFKTIILRFQNDLIAILIDELLDLETFSEIKTEVDHKTYLSDTFIEGTAGVEDKFVLLNAGSIMEDILQTQVPR